MKKSKNIKNKYLLIGLVLIVGLLMGYFIGTVGQSEPSANQHIESSAHQTWTCSMHPQIRQNEPGDCPICGMDLIPLQEEDAGVGSQAVYMSENAMRLANVQTMQVGAEAANKEIRLNGRVAVDERKVYAQTTHIPGRIERLMVNFTGEEVKRGQALATVYSPEMITAQEELLQAYAIRESQPELFQAAKEKLRSWRIGENQINRILENGRTSENFTITADVGGIVTEKLVDLGDYVERGMPLYEIADLSTVWVLFDLYESKMGWIKEGSTVEFTVASMPGETFEGEIDFIDPVVNRQTRVATARVEVDNSNGRLKPEMFVSGVIDNSLESTSGEITVPRSAVLWTGQRSIVYVKQNSGNRTTFNLREVVLGPSLGDSYIISEGLNPGEEIVVNGAFTVDAAAQLAGKPSMMNPEMGDGTMNMQQDLQSFLQSNYPKFRGKASQEFQRDLNKVVAIYLELKDALVQGNEDKAITFSKEFYAELRHVEAEQFEGEARAFWQEKQESLLQHSAMNTSKENLQELRENFVFLSGEMIKIISTFGVGNGQIFVDYCPMANSDAGAYWLSEIREIRNPYYGEAMLTCGEIVAEIE
jgi:Cu(I)/Ag(I) efflux system membrane fusion protein